MRSTQNFLQAMMRLLLSIAFMSIVPGCATPPAPSSAENNQQALMPSALHTPARLYAALKFIRNVQVAKLAWIKLERKHAQAASVRNGQRQAAEGMTPEQLEMIMATALVQYLSLADLTEIAELSGRPGIRRAAALNVAQAMGQKAVPENRIAKSSGAKKSAAKSMMPHLSFADLSDVMVYSNAPSVRRLQAVMPLIRAEISRQYHQRQP